MGEGSTSAAGSPVLAAVCCRAEKSPVTSLQEKSACSELHKHSALCRVWWMLSAGSPRAGSDALEAASCGPKGVFRFCWGSARPGKGVDVVPFLGVWEICCWWLCCPRWGLIVQQQQQQQLAAGDKDWACAEKQAKSSGGGKHLGEQWVKKNAGTCVCCKQRCFS